MYHGKYHNRPVLSPPWRWSRQRLLLLAAALLTALAAVLTACLLAAELVPGENQLWYEGRDSRIQEEFDGVRRTNVSILNTGETDSFFRAAVIITWRDRDGNLCQKAPAEGTDYEIVYGSGWVHFGGYYYWQGPVSPGQATGNLIESCVPLQSSPTDGYSLSVEVLADGVQCLPGLAAKVWGAHGAQLAGAPD